VGGQGRDCAMTSLSRFLVDVISRGLQAHEREVVLGDVAEAGEAGVHAVYDVAGLVVRPYMVATGAWRSRWGKPGAG
jgi:hypothetical protein